jgi:eukaryotic-like serine/threonine-protein kinase
MGRLWLEGGSEDIGPISRKRKPGDNRIAPGVVVVGNAGGAPGARRQSLKSDRTWIVFASGSQVIGTTIGNYRVERLIGEGGMGKVYLAVHPGIGRQAAIKILATGDASDPQIVSRFITEARAANAIRHPNIVDIYDSGVLDDGLPYIAMEFLDGESLSQRLLGGPLPIADAIDVACQVAEALAAAHAHEVVHRDLKPDNLFLIRDPRRLGKLQVKVLDFGIAKLQGHDLGQLHKTRTGALLGTPLYMSPEQCMGAKDIDARTDIYSLGIILFEMVAGKRPFDSDAVYSLITMHVHEPPPPPSQFRSDLSRDVESIILQALAKNPSERQASMAVLLSQLELARGNPAASSEALARAQTTTLRAVRLSSSQEAAVAEIKTLGDTAVSKPVTVGPAQSRAHPRAWLLALGALAMLVIGAYTFRHVGAPPVTPERRKPASPSAAVPIPAVVAKPAQAPPVLRVVEVVLESTPTDAQVYLNDVLVGNTPGRVRVPVSAEPLDFVFRHQGFEPEHVRALPSDGLAVRVSFSTPRPTKHGASGKRKTSRPTAVESPVDIKTER